jgi:hypothetical protein
MKTIESSTDLKTCFSEIKQHIEANIETVKGNVNASTLMNISYEAYALRCINLSYNRRCEFRLQCDSNSKTQLFQVQ